MSLPAILVLGYFAAGLGFAFAVVLKKKTTRGLGLSEEPALFWLWLALWPLMALVWLASGKGKK